MSENNSTILRYIVEPLYQWDLNQVLRIYGISLSQNPEIHFTTEAMERAIVRQGTLTADGVVEVEIPNTLLQKPYTIKVYVCRYEGNTFETLYEIKLPVTARKQPTDYIFVDNGEDIYSFNALENKVDNAVQICESAKADYDNSKSNYDNAVEIYNEASAKYDEMAQLVKGINRDTEDIYNKISDAKDEVSIHNMLSDSWDDDTYSFEKLYPANTYNIEIALDSSATKEQATAYISAQIVGSAITNVVRAYGEVPTIDIPIIIKAVKI